MIKTFLASVVIATGLIAPQANAAAQQAPWLAHQNMTAATGLSADVILVDGDRHSDGDRGDRHRNRNRDRDHRRHRSDREDGHGYHQGYYNPPRPRASYVQRHRYNRGEYLPRYAEINNPHRYGLKRYSRYVRDDDYVYAVDPNTGSVLALIGLVSKLLQ